MFRLLWAASVRTRFFLRRHMPTNILLDQIRTRRGLKWGIPAMLLGFAYFLAAVGITVITNGGPGWANVLVILFVWNGSKFLANGPLSAIALVRVLIAETSQVRRASSELDAES